MKVKELKKLLDKLPGDRELWMWDDLTNDYFKKEFKLKETKFMEVEWKGSKGRFWNKKEDQSEFEKSCYRLTGKSKKVIFVS